ncbi:MAG: hypothetical protein Q9217_002120 [Psora testacea]
MSDHNKGFKAYKYPQSALEGKDTSGAKANKENVKPTKGTGGKYGGEQLRPSTPPQQTGSKVKNTDKDSPDSQVIASGDCSPRSEGIKRADRKDVKHWPGAQD